MSRLSAWLTDHLGPRLEPATLSARRTQLLAEARGRVLELGAGAGANLAHYPDDREAMLLTEPDPHLRRRLAANAARSDRGPTVAEAAAERLPVDAASVDTVVCTLVLCSVDDPAAALAEVRRVLRPGGRLLLLEHVRSEDPRIARWQDRITPVSRGLAGCRPNRDTLAHLDTAGFDLGHLICHLPSTRSERLQPMVQGTVTPLGASLTGTAPTTGGRA